MSALNLYDTKSRTVSAFKPIKKGGEYIDPVAAELAISAVANQGKK
jgi:hypothetical protein